MPLAEALLPAGPPRADWRPEAWLVPGQEQLPVVLLPGLQQERRRGRLQLGLDWLPAKGWHLGRRYPPPKRQH